jgi:hypothetical protein
MYVTHDTIATYASDKVNLKRDDVKQYRDQVGRLRDRLKEYIVTCSPAALTVQAAGIRWVCPPSFQVAATSRGVR